MPEMSHELVAFENGTYSVRPLASSEAMHSHIGPWTESEQVYLAQSGLRQKLGQTGPELVVWDIGMGIAANAVAATEAFLGAAAPARDLRIVSFERHLQGVGLALAQRDRFPWLLPHAARLEELVATGKSLIRHPCGRALRWELVAGDFITLDFSALARPDIAFFDFYSPKTDPELWTSRCFAAIRDRAQPDFRLVTYCSSTAARSAMLLAGFCVGEGAPTPAKGQTTIAALDAAALDRPLGPDWLAKLERSSRPLPADWPAEKLDQAIKLLRAHRQFAR